MDKKRVPMYERLPEIYRIRDGEQEPKNQLKNYTALFEEVFAEIHANIETLYHDLFIETCDDWVIPYIADLLGTSHLKGETWTLRADVANTIALRRRKGTLGAIELLTYSLTRWGVHCVELRENLIWNQHLNHQRPDEGGKPPYSLPSITRQNVIRGGTATVRDPAMLSLLNTPFDTYAHTCDIKAPSCGKTRLCVLGSVYENGDSAAKMRSLTCGNIRYNLPNLAVLLWRLLAYQVPLSKPVWIDPSQIPGASGHIARFDVHPMGEPLLLFNTHRFDPERQPPVITMVDQTPGPIPTARLNEGGGGTPNGKPSGSLPEGSLAGNVNAYVSYENYDETDPSIDNVDISPHGLQLHLPESSFAGESWVFRGVDLRYWELCMNPPLQEREIAIDPVLGRIALGAKSAAEVKALKSHLLLTQTYGAVGPIGAHPGVIMPLPDDMEAETVKISYHDDPVCLRKTLDNIQDRTKPLVIEIQDSMTHELDINQVLGIKVEDGRPTLLLSHSLTIRAAENQRPVIKLSRPLCFRPKNVLGADESEQELFNAAMSRLNVRLEGLYITRDDDWDNTHPQPKKQPLVARAALNKIDIIGCTLDPGGYRKPDGTRAPIYTSMKLPKKFGFGSNSELKKFNQTPGINIERTVTGPLLIHPDHGLSLKDMILDGGSGVNDPPRIALSGTNGQPNTVWGPDTRVEGITVFGVMRVRGIAETEVDLKKKTRTWKGGIWAHALQVHNNQRGCIKFSYFSGVNDRLPQNHGCVKGSDNIRLRFVSDTFGHPAYGQLARVCDYRILEEGPDEDAMGAFGFIKEAHKWRNIHIRFREFMPVGIRALVIPVT